MASLAHIAMTDGPTPSPEPRPIREWTGVDADRFREEIRPRGEPAVLRGVAADWPAVRAALGSTAEVLARLKAAASTTPAPMFEAGAETGGRFFYNPRLDGFNFERSRAPLHDILDRLESLAGTPDAPTVYAGSLSIPIYFPGLSGEVGLPGFIHAEQVLESIWIGNRSRVAPHYDQTENIACVVAGRRRFTLFPTDQVANLYPGPFDLTPAGQPVSLVDPDDPDLERFPRYSEAVAVAQTAELRPGDAIYIPTLWWHGVEALDSFNVLVNYWWRDAPAYYASPADTLLHALLSLKGLPGDQRERWRALFDYLIFQPEGETLGHLPDEARGLFGALTPERAQRIRAFLAKSLAR